MTNLQNRRILLAISSLMIVLGANLFSYSASAQNLIIPNTFASGTPAVAAEVNENFDAIAAAVNGQAEASPLTLRVDTDGFATFDQTDNGVFVGGAAFYVSGVICAELDLLNASCTPIGKFHCWGWLIGPDQAATVVSQEYHLFGRGKIQVQGVEDGGPRAVTGGTGDFKNVEGEATGFDFSDFVIDGEFTATFDLELDDDDDSDSDSDSD